MIHNGVYLSTIDCQNDCRVCPHYPVNSEKCQILYGELGRWVHELGTIYWRNGECSHCGICCGICPKLTVDGCSDYENAPRACKEYPTIEQLYEPETVPDECSFHVMCQTASGEIKRIR